MKEELRGRGEINWNQLTCSGKIKSNVLWLASNPQNVSPVFYMCVYMYVRMYIYISTCHKGIATTTTTIYYWKRFLNCFCCCCCWWWSGQVRSGLNHNLLHTWFHFYFLLKSHKNLTQIPVTQLTEICLANGNWFLIRYFDNLSPPHPPVNPSCGLWFLLHSVVIIVKCNSQLIQFQMQILLFCLQLWLGLLVIWGPQLTSFIVKFAFYLVDEVHFE